MFKNPLLSGSLFVLCLSFLLASNKENAAQKQIKADYFDPKHLGRGQTIPITIAGSKFSSVKSVTFLPAEELTVGEYKLVQGNPNAQPPSYKSYEIPISISRDAALGKRTLLIETPEGQIKKQIEIVHHVPVISDLKITHSHPGAKYVPPAIHCNFIAFDEADDLGKKPEIIAELGPQAFGGTSVLIKASKLEVMDEPHKVKVHVIYDPSLIPFATNGNFRVGIRDKNGYRRNLLAGKVFQ